MGHGRAEEVEWRGEGRKRLICGDPKQKQAEAIACVTFGALSSNKAFQARRCASGGCFVLHDICLTFDVIA